MSGKSPGRRKGYADFNLYTDEAPDFQDIKWYILSPEIRSNPHLIGQRSSSVTPDADNLYPFPADGTGPSRPPHVEIAPPREPRRGLP